MSVQATQTTPTGVAKDTGPLQRAVGKVISLFPQRTQNSIPAQPEGTVYDRLMTQVESFSEDRLTLDEKLHTLAARIFAILLPFIAVYAIGGIVGDFMAPAFGTQSAHVLSYSGELLKSFLALTLARALSRPADGPAHWMKLAGTFLVWFVIQLGTIYVLYLMALQVSGGNSTFDLIRVAGFGLLDVGAVCILFWKGRSLAQHIGQVNTKIAAFRQVHAAQQEEERSKQQAALLDQQHQVTLEAQQKFSNAIVGMMDDFLAQVQQGRNGNRSRISNY